ncbi:MAG: GNAT family N-acetyltransferase [Chlamydiae bacterium]|nr:GNAT family N-acetyltransferase [Chlamydiota bacterium]
MQITTSRLLIRDFTSSDFPDFAHLMADSQVMRFSLTGPMNQALAEEYFQRRILGHYQSHGFGLWALFLEDTKEFIGLAGLISQTIDGIEEVELAYRLHPNYWSKGYATEAAIAISKHAFATMKINHLVSIIDPKNVSSEKVAERVGMQVWKPAVFHGHQVNIFKLSPQKDSC